MSERITKKALYSMADVDADMLFNCGVTYFPFVESSKKIAYSCGVNGCTAVLRRGDNSGALYAARPGANEDGSYNSKLLGMFGAREWAIIHALDHYELLEGRPNGYAVVAVVARGGERFTLATFDRGHNWDVCG